MNTSSIIIIGAGIAGLSAGCYSQMNGFHTTIFEMGDKPGGLCTSWKRKGYTFNGCISWLVGSGEGQSFNRIWQELDAVQGHPFVNHEEFLRIERANGKPFIMYTDIDRFEQHLLELAPADEDVIKEYAVGVRHLLHVDWSADKPREIYSPWDYLEMAFKAGSHFREMEKYGRISTRQFAQRFRDPFLREAFGIVFDIPDFPVIAMMVTASFFHNRNAGYPIGGSQAFAEAIEGRYLDLGGVIQYHSPVQQILVENNEACGVRLANGEEYGAEYVISAADGHATIFDMLAGNYLDDDIQHNYTALPRFKPVVQVALGIARDLSQEPHAASFPLAHPMVVAGTECQRLVFTHYGFDPTAAPTGKSAMMITLPSDYAYWKALADDQHLYESEKHRVVLNVVSALEQRFPGITPQIEVVDVATPLTFERFTGNWEGSPEGWMVTTKTGDLVRKGMSPTLPGLDHFYMAGHWVEPGGGLPPAAASGRKAIQLICHQEKHRFTTAIPQD